MILHRDGILVLVEILSLALNVSAATDMGPAAFLWPPDRPWGAAQDNTPPCGSSEGVTNRTQFPLANGRVSLVLQDESYDVNLAISYSDSESTFPNASMRITKPDKDPKFNNDFATLVSSSNFPEIEPGHECYSISHPPSNITAGLNATLQLSHLSTFDTDENQTFYACADITYVELSSFTAHPLCFNVSVTDNSTSNSNSNSSTNNFSANPSSSGLSGEQIAGIVVGSLAGAALIAAALFLLWSRHQRKVQRDKVIAIRMSDWTRQPRKTVSVETNQA
ncbi:hypothetical protein N7492_008049 [Penicillium capsulatum]|uniref:Copper acquisition factor BIM1-like domain-containing protein n=1 Tax=Penicillium capsulatum TaxID=69766 RepID=A0A9W9LFL3_9EURO|nr:hypothetical protein N7492_008049 [Penicillium capsulatum]KAJ6105458.1 hypothetical protein N7512_008975 [Penicillium capsulatum]